MEKIIEKLRILSEEEVQHDNDACESREQQMKICKKKLLGRCFRIKGDPDSTIEGEDYGRYIYFTEVVKGKEWRRDFYLTAVVVYFYKIIDPQDVGVGIQHHSDVVSECVDRIEGAEMISIENFRNAKWRAYDYINKLIKGVAEEDL